MRTEGRIVVQYNGGKLEIGLVWSRMSSGGAALGTQDYPNQEIKLLYTEKNVLLYQQNHVLK